MSRRMRQRRHRMVLGRGIVVRDFMRSEVWEKNGLEGGDPTITIGRTWPFCSMSLRISTGVVIPLTEIEVRAVRAAGPGGQHVNKTASAAHLFFDIHASSLPDFHKERLLALTDQRISAEGVVVIKAREHRSLESNRELALERLAALVRSATRRRKPRRPTVPTRAARARRMDAKTKQGRVKTLRGKVGPD